MNLDEKIEQEIKKNPELKKVFDEHPERKELYKQKLIDSGYEEIESRGINPKYCKTCRFSHGQPPFEDLPEKAYCMIYSKDEGEAKPPNVYYEGAECEYYEKRKG